ncbi:ABC transporter permease [Bradyrhizobium liaoningense]
MSIKPFAGSASPSAIHVERARATASKAARWDGHEQRLVELGLAAPALLLVGAIALVPLVWLVGLSFIVDGRPSFENYARLINNEAYLYVFVDTFRLAISVTVLAALLGYPTAYLISQVTGRAATILLAFVLLPFWISVVVRAYAWLILLQRKGVINGVLLKLGLIDHPVQLVNNFTGVTISMCHVLLPFMVLPLISSMRAIDREMLKASLSLGASPLRTFWQVFFPLSLPGFTAGTLLVFVQALGYYIMPQILGGGRVQTVAMKIKSNIDVYYDWGASSSLAVVLVGTTSLLFWIVGRIRANAVIGETAHGH